MGEERQNKAAWREPPVPVVAAVVFNLALAAAQLALFLPDVIAGRAADTAVYRVDGLGLVFGVAWCIAAALTAVGLPGREFRGWPALTICLMTVAALNMAYAREPLRLLVAWELMGLSVWLLARLLSGRGLRWLAAALHLPGWAILAAILLGLVPPFAPPFGGEGEAWPAWVAVILGVTALIRSGSWPFNAWASLTQQATGGLIRPVLTLYALAAPFVLAKALVAAPWEPLGAWALTLLGTVSLLGSTWVRVATTGGSSAPFIAPVYAAAAVVGFGLGSVSPLAASGALALLLAGILSRPLLDGGC
jgi:hypothetical protein